jgi:hypothetical protein
MMRRWLRSRRDDAMRRDAMRCETTTTTTQRRDDATTPCMMRRCNKAQGSSVSSNGRTGYLLDRQRSVGVNYFLLKPGILRRLHYLLVLLLIRCSYPLAALVQYDCFRSCCETQYDASFLAFPPIEVPTVPSRTFCNPGYQASDCTNLMSCSAFMFSKSAVPTCAITLEMFCNTSPMWTWILRFENRSGDRSNQVSSKLPL